MGHMAALPCLADRPARFTRAELHRQTLAVGQGFLASSGAHAQDPEVALRSLSDWSGLTGAESYLRRLVGKESSQAPSSAARNDAAAAMGCYADAGCGGCYNGFAHDLAQRVGAAGQPAQR